MVDQTLFPLYPEAVQLAPRVARRVVHHVAAGKPAALAAAQGFSMLTLVISNLVSAAIAGGGAWYVRGRGFAGVKTDVATIKADVSNLKEKIHGHENEKAAA